MVRFLVHWRKLFSDGREALCLVTFAVRVHTVTSKDCLKKKDLAFSVARGYPVIVDTLMFSPSPKKQSHRPDERNALVTQPRIRVLSFLFHCRHLSGAKLFDEGSPIIRPWK